MFVGYHEISRMFDTFFYLFSDFLPLKDAEGVYIPWKHNNILGTYLDTDLI